MDINIQQILVDLLISIINIIVIFIIVRALVYKPVLNFLNRRKEALIAQKQDAEQKQTEAQKLKEELEDRLKQSRAQGDKILIDAQRQAKDTAEKIISDAKDEAKRIIENADESAKQKHDEWLTSAKDEIVDISVDIARKVLSREINDEDNMRIASAFFKQYQTEGRGDAD